MRVTVEAAPDRELALYLRIPGWARGATLRVAGRRRTGALAPGSYVAIRRVWLPGDAVELDLPLPVRLLEAHPLVEEVRNHAAVMRGPLVYCLESADLRKGVGINDVMIPEDIALEPRPGRGALAGLTVLEGTGRALPKSDWSGRLYRERGARAAARDSPSPYSLLRLGQPRAVGHDRVAAGDLRRLARAAAPPGSAGHTGASKGQRRRA